MIKLLSLPPNLVETFHSLDPRYAGDDWFCTSDPAGCRIGSGAGTAWLLDRWAENSPKNGTSQKRIIIHAGGQSRRLPSYATVGKVLTPLPVLRWAVGQRIDTDLLSIQLPLYEKIMELTADGQNTLIASGDVCLRTEAEIRSVPQADVVCYGLWADPQLASHHGVFLSRRESPEKLDCMLQKPSPETIRSLAATHYSMMDIGLWILSDRAVELLRRRSISADGSYSFYDLYSQFGCALGANPGIDDPEIASLTTAIVPLPAGEFYHFGTTRELLSSTLALQNKVIDQRRIIQRWSRPNPAMFVQNCIMKRKLDVDNDNVWVENSCVSANWTITRRNAITGVPVNDWNLSFPEGVCLDIQPIGDDAYAVRPYGFDDPMRGDTGSPDTVFCGMPLHRWLSERDITLPENTDIQSAHIFPLVTDIDSMGLVTRWMISEPDLAEGREIWLNAERLSADEISARASLPRLYRQRRQFLRENIGVLADNWRNSVFYQVDLRDMARKITDFRLEAPLPLPDTATPFKRMRNSMLRAVIARDNNADGSADEANAYAQLRADILSTLDNSRSMPQLDVHRDQIVWGRSPVRIDLAGGWTDTPPYSMLRGGNVVNMAIELNGQPPLQVFVKPCADRHIILRSIDLGAIECIDTYQQLTDYRRIGSPFSIPKAALALAGFAPDFSPVAYDSLHRQLDAFGCGIELTMLAAVPAGSGLGTSSILAATVLSALNDFCALAWDTSEICNRTLALEQLLTTCGGWQDQYGGVLPGIKLLQTDSGTAQQPRVNWLPDAIFTDPAYAPCHILYYTGITRTAKSILGEIVRNMFLNESSTLRLLDEMRTHALDMAQAIQRRDFESYTALLARTWVQNQRLDSGTNPPAVQSIIDSVKPMLAACKLPGAGGGGFLYMLAKDPDAAARIRHTLTEHPVNPGARLIEMTVSTDGLRVSRS